MPETVTMQCFQTAITFYAITTCVPCSPNQPTHQCLMMYSSLLRNRSLAFSVE